MGAAGTALPPGRTARVALLLGFVAVVVARLPEVFRHAGRFWAEEGVVYFHNAWSLPWYDAWFAIHTGYLNLAAGAGTWAGLQLGGIGQAPLVTVTLALALQCLPVYAILTHDFPWSRSLPASAAAVLACALPPVTGEVWLNTITSQFHLALFALLVLAAPAERRLPRSIDAVLLALAALSGPATSFLAPLFVLRAVLDRRGRTVMPAAIVFAGFAVQVSIYLAHIMADRGHGLDLAELLTVLGLHGVVLPFAGYGGGSAFTRQAEAAVAAHRALLAGPAIFLAFYGALAVAVWRLRSAVLAWLLAGNLVILVLSFYEALHGTFSSLLNPVGGQRYALIPEVANLLLVVGIAASGRGVLRWVFAAVAAWMLAVGIVNARSGLIFFQNGPPWSAQVAAWSRDPSSVLQVWPGTPWEMTLPPRERQR